MTFEKPVVSEPSHDPELYLRFHRRSLMALLILILAVGGFLIASVLRPDAAPLRWTARAPFFFPMLLILGIGVQQTWMRKHRIALDSAEFKALIGDEWRQRSMDRATRGALIVTLIAQAPLPLAFLHLSSVRALCGAAMATVTIGLATQIALFLFFDRE